MGTPAKKIRMETDYFCCREEATCLKKYRHKKGLAQHVKRKHLQKSSTPLPPANAYETAVEPHTIIEEQQYDKPDQYPSNPDYMGHDFQDKNHIRSIITEFFTYWNDSKAECRMIDTNALMLIKHSRNCKHHDTCYLAASIAAFNVMHQENRLHLRTLCDVIEEYVYTVREANRIFGWDSLVVLFTMAHSLLMKFPHLYPDLVDTLAELFQLINADLNELGGWDDFMDYSKYFISKQ